MNNLMETIVNSFMDLEDTMFNEWNGGYYGHSNHDTGFYVYMEDGFAVAECYDHTQTDENEQEFIIRFGDTTLEDALIELYRWFIGDREL